ncbi:MAG: LamG domain-containing protein [archaeon]
MFGRIINFLFSAPKPLSKKAQATIEYLIIVSAVIGISLFVVSTIFSSAPSTADIENKSESLTSNLEDLQLLDFVADSAGNGALVLKNNAGEKLTVKSISVDGNDDHVFGFGLVINTAGKKVLLLPSIAPCPNASQKTYSLNISYLSAHNLEKKAYYGNVNVKCVSAVNPIGAFTTESIFNPGEPDINWPAGESIGSLQLATSTVQYDLSITTDVSATCRYATTPDTNYYLMNNSFTDTTVNHTTTISGLVYGRNLVYVRCKNHETKVVNSSDFVVNLFVFLSVYSFSNDFNHNFNSLGWVTKSNNVNAWAPTGEMDWNKDANYTNNSTDFKRDMNGLLGYWKLNNRDSSGYLLNSATGARSALLAYGADISTSGLWDTNAVVFNGSQSHVQLGYILNISGISYSVNAWFNKVASSASGVVVGMWQGGWSKFEINVGSNGNIIIYDTNSSGPDVTISCGYVSSNKWYQVAVVGNYDTNQLSCYVNGSLVSSGSLGSGTYSNGQWNIGARATNSAIQQIFTGKIDEVSVWTRALSAAEIAADYNNFLSAKFVDKNIVDFGQSRNPVSININKNLGMSFGSELSPSEKFSSTGTLVSNSLVGLWHLNDKNASNFIQNSATGLYDVNLNLGADTNESGLWDKNAGYFDGVNDYAAGSLYTTTSSNPITVSSWVYVKGLTGTWQVPFRWGNEVSGQIIDIAVGATSGTAQTLSCDNWTGGTSPYATSISLNTWVHIVCVYDGTSLIEYINGVYKGSWTASIGITSPNYFFGARSGTSTLPFKGAIDDVAIWSRALTSSEVLDLYRKGSSRVDLNVYSCSDSACASKTGSQYLSNVQSNTPTSIASLPDARYFGFDANFGGASGWRDNNAYTRHVNALIQDYNIYADNFLGS